MFIPNRLSRHSAEGRRRGSTNSPSRITYAKHFIDVSYFDDFFYILFFKQQFQALHKKILDNDSLCSAEYHTSTPANDTILRHLREAELEIMTLKW